MMNPENTKQVLAIGCVCVSAYIAIAALYIQPYGEVSDSALWTIAQFLLFAASLLEIQATIEKFTKGK